jgi:hypothetical protein
MVANLRERAKPMYKMVNLSPIEFWLKCKMASLRKPFETINDETLCYLVQNNLSKDIAFPRILIKIKVYEEF